MIRYLKHDEIDPAKWDAVINADPHGKPYAMHHWLTCISPGWEALVKDDYASVMPLPVRSKFGISYIFQPVTAQQLGIFSSGKFRTCLHEFLPDLPDKFRLMQFAVHGDCVCG